MKSVAAILSLSLAAIGALAAPVAEPEAIVRRGVLKRAPGPLPIGDYTVTRSIKAVEDTAKRSADADSSWWVWIPNQQYDASAKEKRAAADADSSWWVYIPNHQYDAAAKEKREAADADASWWVYIPNHQHDAAAKDKREAADADSSWWVYIPNHQSDAAE